LIIANIGTDVVMFPIVRRQIKILALDYVTARWSSADRLSG
jgi:hypothetical protein